MVLWKSSRSLHTFSVQKCRNQLFEEKRFECSFYQTSLNIFIATNNSNRVGSLVLAALVTTLSLNIRIFYSLNSKHVNMAIKHTINNK